MITTQQHNGILSLISSPLICGKVCVVMLDAMEQKPKINEDVEDGSESGDSFSLDPLPSEFVNTRVMDCTSVFLGKTSSFLMCCSFYQQDTLAYFSSPCFKSPSFSHFLAPLLFARRAPSFSFSTSRCAFHTFGRPIAAWQISGEADSSDRRTQWRHCEHDISKLDDPSAQCEHGPGIGGAKIQGEE